MVRRLAVILILMLAGCVYYVGPPRLSEEPMIRVALAEGADSVRVSSDGALFVTLPTAQGTYEPGTTWKVFLACDSLGMVINDVQVVATPGLPVVFRSAGGGQVYVNGRAYRGTVEVRRGDRLLAVNVVPIEAYLLGVVPCELGTTDFGVLEAARAQAVTARSYALRRLGQNPQRGFDVYASVADQVYRGSSAENELGNRAVASTRGLIAAYRDEVVDAKYHSTCGGLTADASSAWSGDPVPYLRRLWDSPSHCFCREPFCAGSPHYHWEQHVTDSDLAAKLGPYLASAYRLSVAPVLFGLRSRRVRPRPSVVVARTTSGDFEIAGTALRRLFNLPSDYFTLGRETGFYRLRGWGWGHGVGMCQWGAMEMARRGYDYRQILRHYYQGITISPLY